MKYKSTDSVKKIIATMLKENTGQHMLDSGGDSGRMWQRNQKRDFDKEPKSHWEVYAPNKEVTVSGSTYHYLTKFLEVTSKSTKLNNEFQKFMDSQEDSYYLQDMEAFAEEHNDCQKYPFESEPRTINTYNDENIIDQILQYIVFCEDDEFYIILQIHGGADARGGYTEPTILHLPEDGADYFILAQYNVNAYEVGGDAGWYSDDAGNNWYPNNDEGESEDEWEFIEGEKFGEGKVIYKKTGKEIGFGVQFDY